MKLMKGDEISLRHLGTSWEGKGHVVKVPDSILFPFLHLLLSYCTTSIQSVFLSVLRTCHFHAYKLRTVFV